MLSVESKNISNFNKTGLIGKFTGHLGKTPVARQHYKQYETDRQMLVRIGRKFAVLFFIILMFDPLSDLLLAGIQAAFDLTHVFIEIFETLFEEFMEYTLQSDHRQSDIILVNGAIVIALYGLFRLYFALPRLYVRIKRNCLATWLRYIRHKSSDWRTQPFDRKFKLITAYTFGITCLLFGLTL